MTTAVQISVIIPTYQRAASVRRALEALSQQTLPASIYEVIVAIDGSKDGTRELVERFAAPYRLRAAWQPNRGRAAACNLGLAEAASELIVILDDDMEPAPDFLEAHLAAHEKNHRLAALGPVPVKIDRATAPVGSFIAAKFDALLVRLSRPGYDIHYREFYSGNVSVRRAILQQVGGFDELFQVYGNEDSDLALRLLHAGVRIVYCPAALAYQHYTKDFAGLARDNLQKGRTAVLLVRKAPETFHDLRLSTYHQGSRKWRALRAGLLALSQFWPGTPRFVIRAVEWLERRRPRRLHLYYDLALDYFFWLGALPAQRADRAASAAESTPRPMSIGGP